MTGQSELRADAARVVAYGERFPQSWAGVMYEGDTLVAMFTTPEDHREALLSLVEHPDSLAVRAAAHTSSHLDEVREQVRALLDVTPSPWNQIGRGATAVIVGLAGGNEHLAQQLHERFGTAVELRVGAHPYPLPAGPARPPRPAPTSTTRLRHATMHVVPDPGTLTAGGLIKGDVWVLNTSEVDRLALNTNTPLLGMLLDEHRHVVNAQSGWVAGTGRRLDLGPGRMGIVHFIAGTETRDPTHGTVLAPGRYDLVVQVLGGPETTEPALLTDPVTIELR